MQVADNANFFNQVLEDPDYDKDTKYLSYDCLYTHSWDLTSLYYSNSHHMIKRYS